MDPSVWYGHNEKRRAAMDVDDDKRVVKEQERESGWRGSEGNLLGHNQYCAVVCPIARDVVGGSIAGRTGSTSSRWGASWVKSCKGMISGSGTKEHRGRLTSTGGESGAGEWAAGI
jgi:hypothetical protein